MTKKKKNSVVTGRSRVSGTMAGKEGQVGAGPPGAQSAIPQAPSLHGCCPPGSLSIRARHPNGYLGSPSLRLPKNDHTLTSALSVFLTQVCYRLRGEFPLLTLKRVF